MQGAYAGVQQSMSLDVVHDRAVAGPRIGPDYAPHPAAPGKNVYTHSDAATNQHSSPIPASQESLQFVASKQTAITSIEPVDGRQLTPASSASRHDSSSPPTARPNGSRALPGYESLPAYESTAFSPRGSSTGPKGVTTYHVDNTAGHKRSADGSIKDARASSAESTGGGSRHMRTTSTASKSSQPGEAREQAKELRTRLAYAKVKVDHGWEKHTINQIESITSQPTSPASVIRGAKPHWSPAQGNGNAWSENGFKGTKSPQNSLDQMLQPTDRPLTAPSRHLNYGQQPDAHTWAQHGHPTASGPPSRGSLAPPVDFSHPRRSQQGGRYIPSLATAGSHSTLSASSQSSTKSPYLNTPSGLSNQPDALRTQSQNTMEQDAIETLLFMRSPGNSATFANYSTPAPFATTGPGIVKMATTGDIKPPAPAAWPAGHAHGHPQQRPVLRMDVDAIPVSPRRREIEEHVLASANLHDSQGIDSALDEIRRRAVVEGQQGDSSDDEDLP